MPFSGHVAGAEPDGGHLREQGARINQVHERYVKDEPIETAQFTKPLIGVEGEQVRDGGRRSPQPWSQPECSRTESAAPV